MGTYPTSTHAPTRRARSQAARVIGGRDALARTVRLASRTRAVTTRITRLHAWLLRHSGGRLRRSRLFALGQPVASLTTIGRSSGRPRSTVVAYFEDGDDLIVAAANLGNERDPAWSRNLEAHPNATVVAAGRRFEVRAQRAQGEDAQVLWAGWVARQPSADSFGRIAGRPIPVFRLTPIGHANAGR
jgi:deazaflavin-dependent oxidoreductase (nitroreductase family)